MTDATPSKPVFQHGLLKPLPRHMTTLFTLLIFWLVGTIVAFVLLPYEAQRLTDGWWTQNDKILFVTSLCFVSTLHGALGYLLGYSRGGKVSNFFLGALLLTIGIVLVLLRNGSSPEVDPQPSTGLMKRLDRLAFACGNLWFGISQLAVMMGFLIVATVYETKVGGTEGNRAAYAAYYNHWSFGLIFVLFFATIFCTTMRKWPFRIPQIGWLATHLGLLVTMAGCMVMFWGTYDGYVKLLEGDTVTKVFSRTERELRVAIPALQFDERFLIEVDRDPATSEVEQVIPFEIQRGDDIYDFRLRIDKFYSKADQFSELQTRRGSASDKPKAGAVFKISMPQREAREIFVLEGSPELSRNFPLRPTMFRIPHRSHLESMAYRYPAEDKRRGRLIAEDADGNEVLALTVNPGPRDSDPRSGAPVGARARLPDGTMLEIQRYYSYLFADGETLRDESPGSPILPGLQFTLKDQTGVEHHSARMDGHWFNSDTGRSGDSRTPYRFRYEAKASNPRPPGSITYVVGPGQDDRNIVITGFQDTARIVPFVEKKVYRMAPNAPVSFTAVEAFDDAVHVTGVRQGKRNLPYGIRLTLERGDKLAKTWVFDYQRDILTETVQLGELVVRLGYSARQTELGYAISLIDFRHENYPNSQKAKRYEANVIIAKGDGEAPSTALVDMNHPLQEGRFRFYNSNPIGDDDGRRGVVFSVGANPGLPTLIVGFIITGIGLLLVFFFKPSLRRWEKRRRAATA